MMNFFKPIEKSMEWRQILSLIKFSQILISTTQEKSVLVNSSLLQHKSQLALAKNN